MKKIVKIIALISVVCVLSSLLSGCRVIRDLKKNIVISTEDGNLVYKDSVYKRLENTENLHFEYGYDEDSTSFIIKKDEPVLYGPIKGDMCEISEDEYLIESFEEGIYCREDKYEYIKGRLEKEFVPEKYMYSYEVEIEPESLFGEYDWETKIRYITSDELAVINDIFKKVKPDPKASELGYESDYLVDIWGCSEDLLIRKEAFNIFIIEDKYYLERYDNDYDTLVYAVPAEYNEIFEEIMEEYVEYEEEMYSDDF